MGTSRRWMGRIRGGGGQAGYTLVEIMASLVVAAVVGLGLYAVYNSTQKGAISQRVRNDLQTGCGFAMDQIKTELALAGYRATDPTQPITTAGSSQVTFEYWDDNADAMAGHDNHTQITFERVTAAEPTYRIAAGDVVREIRRYNTATGAYDLVTRQALVSDTQALSFTYLGQNNTVWSTGLGDIRTIRTALTCEGSREDPNTKKRSVLTLTGEVRARNVGVSGTPQDKTPPAVPTGVIAWDPGECGTLEVRWNANTDADLEGYYLFYGLVSGGTYSKRVRLSRAPKTAGQYEYYTLTGLTSTRLADTTPVQYYVAVQAYDKSGNLSTSISTSTTGNPSPSSRTESAGATTPDTTISPLPPAAPAALVAAATAGVDNSVSLSWTPPASSGLVGYKLFRGETANFTVDDRPPNWIQWRPGIWVNAGGNRIANHTLLDASRVSHTDTGLHNAPGDRLIGCKTYYYKLCAVTCDSDLVATYTASQFASASAVPADNTPPASPQIAARPGFRRIILTLTNPVVEGMGADPDFTYTKVFWSKGTFPTIGPELHAVSSSPPIPRYEGSPAVAGTFRLPGTRPTINFNDETSPTASAPNLEPDTTYYFLAVAYDQCGNHTDVNSSSIAEGTQCGDCLLPAPAPANTPDPACYGPPPTPSGLAAEGCYGYVDVSWDPIDDITNRDFQGFRLLRREGPSWIGGTNEVELTGDYAAWLTTFTDASVEEGKAYSYRLMATDCYYEQHRGTASADWPEPGNDPDDNYSEAFISNVSVGRPLLDPARPEVVTGLIGLDPPWLYHNTVAFWVRNASEADLTLLTLGATWENPEAYLQRLVIGDGNTTATTVAWDETGTPLTRGSGSTLALAPTRLEAADDQIPVVSVFRNVDRSVDRETDMRTNWIDFVLTYRNEATGTEGCAVSASLYAPLGPYVYSVTQDRPYLGTLGWAVPGESGTNFMNGVAVAGGEDVTVTADVLDASGTGIPAGNVLLLYYVDSSRGLTAAPAITGTWPSLNYSAVAMTRIAGDEWRGVIPAADDSNVWYLVLAVDEDGNFDRDPEPWAGAYQYYQQAPDTCSTVPNPPTLAGLATSGTVVLAWAAPTTNATPSGSAYSDPGGYKVYRDDGSGWALLATISDPATTGYTDSGVPSMDSIAYRYYVSAFDTCDPTPNESAASNIYTETVESDCGNTPGAPVLAGFAADLPGRVQLTWSAPTANAPPSAAPLTDLAGYRVWRQQGTAPFVTIADLPAGTLTYTDTTLSDIRAFPYSFYITAYDTCSPTPNESYRSNIYTEPLVFNPCDETPNPPTLSGVATSAAVTLTWAAPTHNTNGEIFQDPGGYDVYRRADGGPWSQIATTGPATFDYEDTGVAGDIGTVLYEYQVVVWDNCTSPAANRSGPSNVYAEDYVGPCGTVPGAPALSGASSASGVTLTWTEPANAVPSGATYTDSGGYRVYRRAGSTGSWSQLGGDLGPATFSYGDAPADIGTEEYQYAVQAFDTCSPTPNVGAYSNVYVEGYIDPCAFLTTPGQPGTLDVTAGGTCTSTRDMSLSWTAATPAPEGYRVYGCSLTDGTTSCDACGVTQPWVRLNTLDPQADLTFTHTPGPKFNSIVWCYATKAVNKGSCADPSRWAESPFNANAPLIDPCP